MFNRLPTAARLLVVLTFSVLAVVGGLLVRAAAQFRGDAAWAHHRPEFQAGVAMLIVFGGGLLALTADRARQRR